MSVRQALLALLEEGPMYGYQLRSEFERRTGATWPLNVGQVYTTLTRLERDGLVAQVDPEPGAGGDGHVVYQVTDAGREEVATWFTTPVGRSAPPRDELAIKLALAVTVPGVDVGTVIQQQRSATISALQDYTRLKRDRDDSTPDDLAWGLVLDSLVFAAEAEVRWLDHCEARLRRAAMEKPGASVPGPGPRTSPTERDASRERSRG
jgi:DNA-binding PadR family transcriptional regulator